MVSARIGPMIKIAPSILSADFAALGHDIARVEAGGADQLHVDVMDGRFVPNITIGPVVVAAIRKRTRLPLDVHLMIVEPERYISEFVAAGADMAKSLADDGASTLVAGSAIFGGADPAAAVRALRGAATAR